MLGTCTFYTLEMAKFPLAHGCNDKFYDSSTIVGKNCGNLRSKRHRNDDQSLEFGRQHMEPTVSTVSTLALLLFSSCSQQKVVVVVLLIFGKKNEKCYTFTLSRFISIERDREGGGGK